jgi:hypothetical protein
MRNLMISSLAVASLLSMAPAMAAEPTSLTLTSNADVSRAPDLVTVSGGVTTTAPSAGAAMAENARTMTAVIAAVKKAGVAERDVQTQGLSLQPQYSYESRKQVLTGYQASNTVRLRLRDVANVGPLLDTLVKAGANQISGPDFALDKPEAALDEARREAVAKARARATLYAEAAGMKVARIAAITEGSLGTPEPRPMLRSMAMAEDSASPPVAPGEVSLGVSLTVRFELE